MHGHSRHLFVSCDPQFGIHRLVKYLKGIRRRSLREEFPSQESITVSMDELLLLWNDRNVTLETVKKYVENQKGKSYLHEIHASNEEGQRFMVNTSSTGQNPFEPRRNLALTARQVVYRNTLIELIQYKPTTESVYATPLLFIPPWINKFYILDMQPQNSLIKFMVDNGFTVFVISWKNPDAAMEEISFNDYLTLGPLNAFDVIKEIIGSLKVNPIGYCVSGTLLSAAILYLVVKGDDTINAATFFLKGIPIDLKQIQQDVYAVGAEQDHIVPWKSAWRISQLASGTVRFVLGDSGHIAGVINPPTKGRGYWTNDKPVKSAEQWFEGAEQHKGSWWTDWLEWLKTRSGEQVVPPSLGNEVHPPIVPAPGTYVLEK